MLEKNTLPLYLMACRQAVSLGKKGNYAIVITKLSSLQGEMERDILQSGEYSKELLNLYLYVFIKLYEARYHANKNDEQIEMQFRSSFDFLSSLPENMHTRSALCHLSMFHSFHMRYHSHSQEAILDDIEHTHDMLVKTSRSDHLDNSPMYSQFLVESAIYVEKKKLKNTGALLNLFEEALLYLDVYCSIDNVHLLYRYFSIRHKALWGKARCHLRMHETRIGLLTLLHAVHCRLNAFALYPVYRFSKPLYKKGDAL